MGVLQHQIGELKIAASPPPNPIAGDGGLRRTSPWATEQLGPVGMLAAKPTILCMMHAEQQILWDPLTGEGLCVLGPQRKGSGNLTTTTLSARCRAASRAVACSQGSLAVWAGKQRSITSHPR